MRILNRTQSKILDQRMKSELNLGDEILVEAVAAQASLQIQRVLLKKTDLNKFLPVTVVCGPGHNGLDGLVIARHLSSMGISCEVFSAPSRTALLKQELARLNLLGISTFPLEKLTTIREKRVVVDALFGVGLNRNLEEFYRNSIRWMNERSQFTFSVDTPSGLDVDTGHHFGEAVRASITLSVGFLKPGFFSADGPEHCGRLHLVSAGFNERLLEDLTPVMKVKFPQNLKTFLPQSSRRFHKGSTGKCHFAVGSGQYPGAASLVARGALSSGASFVIAHGESSLRKILMELPEVIFQSGFKTDWIHQLGPKDVVALGSGAPDIHFLKNSIEALVKKDHQRVLLDAEALRVVKDRRLRLPANWILTPHPGEMAELLDCSAKDVEANRILAAVQTQEKWGGQVLLKGYQPLLVTSDREIWFLPYGDERLGKAGSGDILTGVIGGLWSQMDDGRAATSLAVYIQAEASRKLTKGRARRSLLPSEVPQAIGQILNTLILSPKT